MHHLVNSNHDPMQPSVRKKITYGYVVTALLILGISLFAFAELRLVEEKIHLGERVTALYDTGLEIRRFERNFFLHAQPGDYQENQRYVSELTALLQQSSADIALLGAESLVATLHNDLQRYDMLMTQYANTIRINVSQARKLEEQIRAIGKHMVTEISGVVERERQFVGHSLKNLRYALMVSITVVVALVITLGLALSRRVVQPLTQLAQRVESLTAGRRDTLTAPSLDREVVSVTDAINHLLQELEVRQRHLLRSEKLAALGTMLSGVAHELNNPLSNIWSSCQILLEELDDSDLAYKKELLNQIDEQSIRARNIVRSLLDFARDRQFTKEYVKLRPLIEQTKRFLRSELTPQKLLQIQVDDTLEIFADRQRLQQVFLNLLKNALEAIQDSGTVTITAQPTDTAILATPQDIFAQDCRITGNAVDIIISDTGQGIDPKVIPRIFDPFFTTKDVGKGMGLGLFIVYEIIDEHGGCILVTSTPGKGTIFYIRLPNQGNNP